MTVIGPRSERPRPPTPQQAVAAPEADPPKQQRGAVPSDSRVAYARADIAASRLTGAPNAAAMSLLANAVAAAVTRDQSRFNGLFRDAPVTIGLDATGLKGCFPGTLAERGVLSRFLKQLDVAVAMRSRDGFADDLRQSVACASDDSSAIADFDLHRGPKGYEVVVHRTSAAALARLQQDSAAALEALWSHVPIEPDLNAPFTRASLIESLSDRDQEFVYPLLNAIDRLNLVNDAPLAMECGLTQEELGSFMRGAEVTTGRGQAPVLLGILRYMAHHDRQTLGWTEVVPFTSKAIAAKAAALTPKPQGNDEIPQVFAHALACLNDPAAIKDAMSVIRARAYTDELDDSNFKGAIGVSRETLRELLENPSQLLLKKPPSQIVSNLLKVRTRQPLPQDWWTHTTLDRPAIKELHTRWTEAHDAAATADFDAKPEKDHRVSAAHLFASVHRDDFAILSECLAALEEPGFRPGHYTVGGILGIGAKELETLLAGDVFASHLTAVQILDRLFRFVTESTIEESQWRATMTSSPAQVREAAARFREKHRDAL